MGHSSQLAISIQVNAERHSKWLAVCMMWKFKVSVEQLCPKVVRVKKCIGRGKAIKGRQEEERKARSLGGETVIRCRRTAFYVRGCRWSAKFVFDLIPHRANIFLRFAHLGRDHPP